MLTYTIECDTTVIEQTLPTKRLIQDYFIYMFALSSSNLRIKPEEEKEETRRCRTGGQ